MRVWAPAATTVEVVLGHPATSHTLASEPGGYFSAIVPASAGDRYRFRLNGGGQLYPDPASRFQPDGPHGDSLIVDPAAFKWSDSQWKGTSREGQVVYELHVGTFTPEGTWEAAARELGGAPGAGGHGDRTDAGGGVRRAVRLGL